MAVIETQIDYQQASLAELVPAARDGDRAAQSELIIRYEPTVYATAMRRLGNHAESQELCQDVFVQALEKLHQLQIPEAFGGWLRSITTRMAINLRVRRAPMVATEPHTLAATCVENSTPLERALTEEARVQVRAGLDRLATLDRETLVAFYVKGQSLREMADHFRSPVGTIKRRLHVARKRLAEELK